MSLARSRVVLEGSLGGGRDIWSMGFAGPDLSAEIPASMQDNVNGVYTAFAERVWIGTGLAGNISDTVTWDRARLYDIDAFNRVIRTFTSAIDTPTPGGTSTNSLPTEVAVCVSLTTALSGARHRGRMYFPPLAINAVHDEGLLQHSVRDDLAQSMKQFLQHVNDDTDINPYVYSDTAAELTRVTGLRVGDVFDSQRRRRNSIVESYYSQTISP